MASVNETSVKRKRIHVSMVGIVDDTLIKLSLNFTHFYFADVLLEKFGNNNEYKQMSSVISRWLSGAADREGGRKNRKCKNLTE